MKIYVTVLALTILLLSSQAAHACICVGEPRKLSEKEIRRLIAQEYSKSAAVFSGEVVELGALTLKIKVKRMWKGDAVDEITMLIGAKRVGESIIKPSSCDYIFELGKKYLVYARGKKGELRAFQCTRTGLLEYAGREITELDNLNLNAY